MTTKYRQKICENYTHFSSVKGRETFFARRIGFSGLANSNMLPKFFREQMTLLWQPNLGKNYKIAIIICPIVIAYSMGQIIKSVCVCQSVRVSVCVCPSVSTLTVAFLDRFSPKLAQTQEPRKVRTSSLGVNIAPPLPLFCPQNPHFRPRGPENPCK